MASNITSSCWGCVFGVIAIIVVLALIAAFVFSNIYTIEQVGYADKEGVLVKFDEKYTATDTFRSEGMESWKVWDVILWIIKSGNYEPSPTKSPFTK